MKKLKDFFYDKNDIIIVLLIIAIAGFIIYNRIDAIMDYPAKYAAENEATATQAITVTSNPSDITEPLETTEPSTDSSDEE